jgi:multicomponent Na+:H+ antiporter subunit A
MLVALLALAFGLAPLALLAQRAPRPTTGWCLALVPLALFVILCLQVPAVLEGSFPREIYPWAPQLGLQIDLALDGLSLLFGLIISGIGVLIVGYAGHYMAGDQGMGRFLCYLQLFMGAMLGLVLAGNALTMFVFWELTSVTSYLLIGYKHEYPEARKGAQQSLLITGFGGLALLVGLLLLGEAAKRAGVPATEAYSFAAINAAGSQIRADTLYTPALMLVFLGCFTKSAQVPFHFWLPGAMQAPTPASAFLHSATMVKAGIYLLARLHPGLSGAPLWDVTLTVVGGTTLLFSSWVALKQNDIKALLAYSTISMLGTLTMLAGLGGAYAQRALVTSILAHALYKSALFMLAGIIDHAAHTRDLRKLGGLRQQMPRTMVLVGIALLSMGGIPILFGFVAKELLLEAALQSPQTALLRYSALGVVVVSAALAIAYGWRLFSGVFLTTEHTEGTEGGVLKATATHGAHDPELGMLVGPGIPVLLSLVLPLGLLPFVSTLLAPAVAAVAGEPIKLELALWHGFNLALGLSITAIVLGVALARFEQRLAALRPLIPAGADLFERFVDGVVALATGTTRAMIDGRLRSSVRYTLMAWCAFVGIPMALYGLNSLPTTLSWEGQIYEILAAALIPIAVLATIRARSRLGAIIAVGMVGAMVSLLFVIYSAPDLALTQLLIEVLSTVFLVLVFSVLPPRFKSLSSTATRVRDGIFALVLGTLMTGMVLAAATSTAFAPIAPYFNANSLSEGKGANVVNVIIVDFRGFDTLGEITVLFIAVLGIYGMLRMRGR